jgi:phospholipid transport system substrate-binding protein
MTRLATVLAAGAWLTAVVIAAAAPQAGFATPQGATGNPASAPAAAQPAAQAPASSSQEPSDIVQGTAQSILKDLEANRDAYRKEPAKVGQLVDRFLLPHFDTETAAKLVLGQYWRNATPDQRKRFIDAFYHSLVNNYGSALTEFTADRLKVYPSKVDPGADRATVRTEIRRDNGDHIAVNYSLLKKPDGWKAYDVNIDGISYVKSYREDFGPQIQQQGLDAVIARLERGEKPSEINKTTKAAGSKS